MNKTGTLTGVGLGPGDPELITVKGLKALQSADIIFHPATEENSNSSFSARILDALDLEVSCTPLFIPMSGKNREQNYNSAFLKIQDKIAAGKNVVVVCEGDLLFYSTFGYLFKLAQQAHVKSNLIPGIPAFIAAGALGTQPIVEGNNHFEVIARPKDFKEIEKALEKNQTLVVMKMSVLDGWFHFLANGTNSFLYAERVGTNNQFVTFNADDLQFRKIRYFSIIIFYSK